MKIKLGNSFKKFNMFSEKIAEKLNIVFDNCSIKCSSDHKFKSNNIFKLASDLKIGDTVDNLIYGTSTVVAIEKMGIGTVITPVDVEGKIYESDNGLINHNCSFIGSSQTLIDPNILSDLIQKEPVDFMYDLDMAIYEKPIPGALYVMGVDCSTGVGNDYAAIQILKINSRTSMEQVCTYQSNLVSPGKFARIIDATSKMYNDCYYILENNDVGRQVAEELWYTLENMSLINTDKHGLGTRADKKSKLDACMELKRLVDSKALSIIDANTITQLSRFEELPNSPNVFKGAKGSHDDLVSALYWAVYATLQYEIDMDSCKIVKPTEQEDVSVDVMVERMNQDETDFWSDFK